MRLLSFALGFLALVTACGDSGGKESTSNSPTDTMGDSTTAITGGSESTTGPADPMTGTSTSTSTSTTTTTTGTTDATTSTTGVVEPCDCGGGYVCVQRFDGTCGSPSLMCMPNPDGCVPGYPCSPACAALCGGDSPDGCNNSDCPGELEGAVHCFGH